MRSSSNLPAPPEDSVLADAAAWILVLAVALVPLLFLPVFQSGFEVPRRALVLIVVGPIAALLISRSPAERNAARGPVLCVVIVIVAGVLARLRDFDLHQAWRSLRYLGLLIPLILAGSVLMRPRFLPRLHLALVLPAIPVLAIGLVRRHLGFPAFLPDRPDVHLSSTIGNSNELGEAFATVFLAGLALSPAMPGKIHRALMWAGTAAAFALVMLSHSRGAWLATAVGLLVAVLLEVWSRRDQPKAVFRLSAALLLAAIAFFVMLGLPAGDGLRETLRSFVSTTHPTNVVRLETWGATGELIRENLPGGAGIGNFEAAFLPHRRALEWEISGADTRVDNPHQEFLWIASESGIAGLAAFAALFVIAFWRATRKGEGPDAPSRASKRALLLVTTALVVLCFFRAPFHHPSGIVVFATLLGSVGARTFARDRFKLDLLVVPLLGALVVLAALDATEDLALGRAVAALNAGKAAQSEGRVEDVATLLNEAGRRVRPVKSAILKDFDRTFRASLAAAELADLKDKLRQVAPGSSFPDLPDQNDVNDLLEEVLHLCPNHPGATNELARLWLRQGSVARAIAILKGAAAALPSAPLFRHNIAKIYADADQLGDAYEWMRAELAIRVNPTDDERVRLASLSIGLGNEEATFGRYLGPVAPAAPLDLPRDLPPLEQRKALLLRLLAHPDDGVALARLADVDFSLGVKGGGAEIAQEGNRAFARSRARFAVEAIEAQNLDQAEIYLKLAAQKDVTLLDVPFLRARVAARNSQTDSVLRHLRTMLDRNVSKSALRTWIARDPDLAPWLSDGRLSTLGLDAGSTSRSGN